MNFPIIILLWLLTLNASVEVTGYRLGLYAVWIKSANKKNNNFTQSTKSYYENNIIYTTTPLATTTKREMTWSELLDSLRRFEEKIQNERLGLEVDDEQTNGETLRNFVSFLNF